MPTEKKDWKAVQADWDFIQTQSDDGTLLCLTRQERSALMTFLRPAYWPTRWLNSPSKDTLENFAATIEGKLMDDCTLSLVQIGCTINLLLNGVVISSMPFDGDACAMIGGSDGEGGGWYPLPAQSVAVEDKKTELYSGALALVEYCSEAVLDFFAAIDAEIELGKAVTVWMEAVPGLNLSPAYEVLQAADSLNSMMRSAFLAADTPDWREQESCRIMCWCVDNDYQFDRTVIDTWRAWLLAQGFDYPEQGYFQFVNAAEYRALLNRFALGMNDEDEDWMILCDTCGVACGVLTFDDEMTDLDYEIVEGTIVEELGNPDDCIQADAIIVGGFPDSKSAEVLIELPADRTVREIAWDYIYWHYAPGTDSLSQNATFYDDMMVELEAVNDGSDTGANEWHTQIFTLAEPVEDVRFIRVRVSFTLLEVHGTSFIRWDNVAVTCQELPP